jgi:alkaline phosphatase
MAYVVTEMLDFDRVLGDILSFAEADGETLVIVTADHETGGLSITGGDVATGSVEGSFSTGGHTAITVPVYAFGPARNILVAAMKMQQSTTR